MREMLLSGQTFNIFGLEVPWYGTMIAIGMLAGILCAYYICRKKSIDTNMPINLALYALPCAIVGARIYYCALNGVSSFWQIFEVWNGGLAIYGGVIGGFLGVLLCCKIHKYSLLEACDLCAPCLFLGQAIGRIGCYFAGCCYGIEPSVDYLKVFPVSVQIGGVWHLATFFYESILDLLGVLTLLLLTGKVKEHGVVTSGYFIFYGTIRAILEQYRDPKECLMLGNFRASQLLSVLLVITGCVLLVTILIKSHKKEAVNG